MAVTHPEHSLVQAAWPLDLRVSPQAPWLPVLSVPETLPLLAA